MKQDDSGKMLEPGSALKNKNFNSFTLRFFLITIALLVVICAVLFWLFRG